MHLNIDVTNRLVPLRRRFDLKFILTATLVCLCLVFIPGFECSEQNDYIWEGRPEHGSYFLTLTPSTVIITQGGTESVTVDFTTADPQFATPPLFFDYKIEDQPEGLQVRKEREGDFPFVIKTYRIEYRVEAETASPGIYSVPVKAVMEPNPDPEMFKTVYAEKTLTVVVVPQGIAGTASAKQLIGGASHSLAVLSDNSVWSWGLNHKGQLGDGTTTSRLAPVPVQGLPGPVTAIAAGAAHSLALLADGTIWGWGDNSRNQISIVRDTMILLPIEADAPEAGVIVAIAAGAEHSMYLRADGLVFCKGANDSGQLGRGSVGSWSSWGSVSIDIPRVFTAIAAGGDFSLAIDDQGRVWGWGDNTSGQLGDNSPAQYLAPVPIGIFDATAIAAGNKHVLALTTDGTVTTIGGDPYAGGPYATTVPGLSGVVEIAAGFFHSLALTSDGIVYGWGDGSFGQLAIPQADPLLPPGSPPLVTPLAEASTIAAGGRHSLAMVTQCATLLSWGDNGAGQLGDGTGQSSAVPVKVFGIGEDGSSYGCDVSLSVILVGKGKVRSEPAEINCGEVCSGLFAPGTMVSLIAEPEPGWTFKKWDGDAAGTERTTLVTLDTSKICIAYFASEPIPPVARFSVGPDYPLTTDEVKFDASGSYDNGWIARYEWDFDNNGSFDEIRERTSLSAVVSAEFVTESWTAGTHTIKLRVTDNDGMTDETTGEIHVREPEPPEYDLGDAPDSSNTLSGVQMIAYPQTGVIARYPTVYRTGSPPYGPIHHRPRASFYLGKNVSLENEADVGIDEDGTNNISPATDSADRDDDDGVSLPSNLPYCGRASMDCTLTVVSPPNEYIYVNVWFDWNRDGDWDDVLECPDGTKVPEWGVRNEEEYIYDAGTENLWFSFKCWHPSEQAASHPMWIRVTVSEQLWSSSASRPGGSGPPGGYEFGETEDYLIQP